MRLVMMGTGTFAQPTLEALLQGGHQVVALVTQPDRTVGQQRGSTRLAERGMKHIALEHEIPIFQPDSVNTVAGVDGLRSFSPDLLVVAAYGQILSRDVLATAAHGGINVHASLLPAYRGAAPIAWAIYHGERRTGVTIIRMSIYLDAGDILAQEPIDILQNETAGELEARLGPLGAQLAAQTVERMATGPVVGLPQDKSRATKAPKLTKQHGLIDWTKSAEQVRNHVRAMQPWPTAYTFLHRAGQPPLRVILCRANVSSDLQVSMPAPGQAACDGSNHRLVVGAGLGTCVEIVELQPAGKRRLPAAEFLRGYGLRPGDRFGPEQP
jgi:methionyl-tRNA formyltransferase